MNRVECVVPGMRVTVYFPPYLVGLKMSDCTVAYAEIDPGQQTVQK
jgi:hypothetical protein